MQLSYKNTPEAKRNDYSYISEDWMKSFEKDAFDLYIAAECREMIYKKLDTNFTILEHFKICAF